MKAYKTRNIVKFIIYDNYDIVKNIANRHKI